MIIGHCLSVTARPAAAPKQGPIVTDSDRAFSHRSLPKTAPTKGTAAAVTDSDRYSHNRHISKIAHARGEALSLKKPLSVTAPLFELPPEPIPHPAGGWLPEWLAAEIRAGHGNAYRTYAVWTRCRKCDAIILTGLDDPVIAASAAVDPTPLTPVQELICALEHRATYRLMLAGSGARIQWRDKWQPPAGGDPPVVPAHKCAHRFPGFLVPPAIERPTDGKPPF